MGMGANQDDRAQTGRTAMVSQGSRHADCGVGGRARGSRGAGAQTPGSQARKRETPGRKTTKASVSATSTPPNGAERRPANQSDNSHAARRDPGGTRGERKA